MDKATVRAVYFALIPSVISYYTFYFLVFPKLRDKKFFLSLVYALLIAIGAALIGAVLIYVFLGEESLTGAQESFTVGVIFISFVDLVTGVVALVTRGRFFRSMYQATLN